MQALRRTRAQTHGHTRACARTHKHKPSSHSLSVRETQAGPAARRLGGPVARARTVTSAPLYPSVLIVVQLRHDGLLSALRLGHPTRRSPGPGIPGIGRTSGFQGMRSPSHRCAASTWQHMAVHMAVHENIRSMCCGWDSSPGFADVL
jgi:hypothetical protein